MEFIKNKQIIQDLKTQAFTRDVVDSYKERFAAPRPRITSVKRIPVRAPAIAPLVAPYPYPPIRRYEPYFAG